MRRFPPFCTQNHTQKPYHNAKNACSLLRFDTHPLCALLFLLFLPSCTSPASPTLDDQLRLHHIQIKGTHNSYHISPNNGVKPWDYTHAPLTEQLDQQGVRKFELDLYWSPEHKRFDVLHVPGFDPHSRCPLFTDCLSEINAWSSKHPTHLPVFVFLEAKESSPPDGWDLYYQRLEAAILSVFPRKGLFTPDDLRKEHPSLQAALQKDGWPTLREVRGKVLFVLLVGGEKRDAYTKNDPAQQDRLCFVTAETNDPFAAIVKIDSPLGNEPQIQAAIRAHLIVRTRADSPEDEHDPKRLAAALQSGAHIISTDVPVPQAGTSYVVTLPNANPARCNPILAPPECTPQALEDLASTPSKP
ncbi:phosphatidylinositol-specific phospholipase C1-like protein [Myxococcota bacterium]|nr:phosphatidylinositol-specific phospholipase C1-like protein [Myxococcota bacterium]